MPSPIAASRLPDELRAALDQSRVEAQAAIWSTLTVSQRERAKARLEALRVWKDGKSGVDVDVAAKIAKVSPSRFYRIAAGWRDAPSLAALGIFAPSGVRKSKIDTGVSARLSAAARQAALLFGKSSVSALVEHMLQLAHVPDADLPGMTKLREIAMAEQRLLDANKAVGQVILFDCVATSLPREDRRPHIAFLCVDEGSRVVLGVAVGTIEAVVSGHAAAAADALRTIADKGGNWPWSNDFSIMRFTAGEDIGRIAKLSHRLNATFREQNFILERKAKRYGRLIGAVVGPRMGRVTFTPTRTLNGEAMATNGDMTSWPDADAYAALRHAADEHNAALPRRNGAPKPPPCMLDALSVISGAHD